MKKTFLLIALAAVMAFVSCEKSDEGGMKTARYGDPVFTASILKTKTTVNTSTGKVEWEDGDEVTITDASSVSVVYTVSSISEGKATLTKKAGESETLGSGPYTAVYGPASLTTQNYAAVAGYLPMTAASATTELSFSVSCGLMEVTLEKDGESISSVAVSDGVNTYTLNCATSQEIAGGKAFCVALPAGSYTSFAFTNENGGVCTKTGGSVTIAANQIQPISFSKLSFSYIVHNASELYSAIAACQDGDKIMLAEGTYTATETFAITKNITLEGGYGASPAIGDVPAPQTYKATLDGADTYRVMSINAIVAAGKSVKLSGLVLQNGVGDPNGGGLNVTKGKVVIDNVNIMNNTATSGAGFVVTGINSKASFTNCIISGNTTTSHHANYVYDGAEVRFDYCVFQGNTAATQGGALTLYTNNADQGVVCYITNSEFYNNRAETAYGGAISIRGDGAASGVTANIANCTIHGNYCKSYGSAIIVYNRTEGNSATANIYSCTITGNSTSDTGTYGAVFGYDANKTNVNVYNSIISGNTCSKYPARADANSMDINENNISGGTVSDYLATSASSKDGYLTKAYKVKTAATTAGMNAATLATKYTGGDSEFAVALAVDQWGATRSGTTAGACVTVE